MNPGIMLAAQHPNRAGNRMAEAADAAGELKWPRFAFHDALDLRVLGLNSLRRRAAERAR
jgi:hypothetical protein